MKLKHRVLPILLSLVLLIGLFPNVPALALNAEGAPESSMSLEEIQALLDEGQDTETPTAISRDRAEGIGQIQTIIPDYNFAAAIYDALYADNHLGTEGQVVKEVLATYEGKIDANGYVKKTKYTVDVYVIDVENFEFIAEHHEVFYSQEETQAYLDSFQDTDAIKHSKKVKSEVVQTTEQKPDSELIHSIEGIEWLRRTAALDLSNNAITDITMLSEAYLGALEPEYGHTNVNGGQSWFGGPGRNLYLNLAGNPVRKLFIWGGGHIAADYLFNAIQETIDVPAVYFIKPEENPVNWTTQADIEIPLIEMDGERMKVDLDDRGYDIYDDSRTGASIDIERINDEIFPIVGIPYSGIITGGVRSEDMYYFRSVVDHEGSNDNGPGWHGGAFWKLMKIPVHIYTIVKPVSCEATTIATMEKTVTGTDTPAPDTEFQLYTATLKDGQYIKGEPYQDPSGQEVICTTDEQGQFTFSAALPVGDYCFVETEAGPGLVLDDTTVYGFSVGTGGTLAITGGDNTIEPSDGSGPITAEDGSTFIDRYSPDVDVTVTPDDGMTLSKIIITYFDRETQTNKTVEVDTAQAAADWINENKGDEDNVGVIDGTVSLKPIFTQEVQFEAENAPITDPDPKPDPEDKTGNLIVSKTVSGTDGDTSKEFTFTVTLEDTTITGTYGGMTFADGVATFKLANGQSKTAVGLPAGIKYTVTESDNSGYTVTSTGETGTIPEGQEAEAAFDNYKSSGGGGGGGSSYTSVTVKKVWKLDDGGTAPDSITVALMRDGKQYKTVELNEGNGWTYTWNRLNDRYNWTVEELDVPDGFTVSVDKKGTVITITNDDKPTTPTEPDEPENPDKPVPPPDPDIPDDPDVPEEPDTPTTPENPGTPTTPDEPDTPTTPDKPDEPGLPQTGQLWWPVVLLVVVGAVLVLTGVFVKKKYHGKHEA